MSEEIEEILTERCPNADHVRVYKLTEFGNLSLHYCMVVFFSDEPSLYLAVKSNENTVKPTIEFFRYSFKIQSGTALHPYHQGLDGTNVEETGVEE